MRALHIIVLLIQRVNKSSFSVVFRAFEGKYIGCAKRKDVFEDAQNAQIQIQIELDICSPFIHLIVSNKSVSKQRRPSSGGLDF